MKIKSFIIVTLALLVNSGCSRNARENNSLKLWYQQPASSWEEALPVGNGRIGAMVYGDPRHETLQQGPEERTRIQVSFNKGLLNFAEYSLHHEDYFTWSGTPLQGRNCFIQ